MTSDDKPLTPAQARQKFQRGLTDYLAGNLKFPIFTTRWVKSGPFTRKKVSVPLSWSEPPIAEEFDEKCPLYGIGLDEDEEIEVPLEVIELKKEDQNYRPISDYTYWSNTWRSI